MSGLIGLRQNMIKILFSKVFPDGTSRRIRGCGGYPKEFPDDRRPSV